MARGGLFIAWLVMVVIGLIGWVVRKIMGRGGCWRRVSRWRTSSSGPSCRRRTRGPRAAARHVPSCGGERPGSCSAPCPEILAGVRLRLLLRWHIETRHDDAEGAVGVDGEHLGLEQGGDDIVAVDRSLQAQLLDRDAVTVLDVVVPEQADDGRAPVAAVGHEPGVGEGVLR